MAYLQKIIDVVSLSLNQALTARPSKASVAPSCSLRAPPKCKLVEGGTGELSGCFLSRADRVWAGARADKHLPADAGPGRTARQRRPGG
jgi:hypothetical protein